MIAASSSRLISRDYRGQAQPHATSNVIPLRQAAKRLQSLGLGIFYGFTCGGIIDFSRGAGGPSSGNTQSVDLTARAMAHPGGQWLIALIGIGLSSGPRRIAAKDRDDSAGPVAARAGRAGACDLWGLLLL